MWRKWSVIRTGYLLVKDYQYISKNATSLLGLTLREDIQIFTTEITEMSSDEMIFKFTYVKRKRKSIICLN